jgi:hypothetical protein
LVGWRDAQAALPRRAAANLVLSRPAQLRANGGFSSRHAGDIVAPQHRRRHESEETVLHRIAAALLLAFAGSAALAGWSTSPGAGPRADLGATRPLADAPAGSPLSDAALSALADRSWIEHDCRGAGRAPESDEAGARWVSPAAGGAGRIGPELACYLRDVAILAVSWQALRVEREDAGGSATRVWFDPASVQHEGAITRLRMRYDGLVPAAPAAGGPRVASQVVLHEFDCERRTFRERFALGYSGPRLQGRLLQVSNGEPGRWQAVPARTPVARDFEFACRAR